MSDAGPLIALAKLDLLKLLPQLFAVVHVPQTVFKEATRQNDRVDARRISDFVPRELHLLDVIDNKLSRSLSLQLDEGEVQAIAHARELKCGVLMDEKRGRMAASHNDIPTIGVVGVLLQAKQRGLIPNVTEPLQALQIAEYRISEALYREALRLSGELSE